MSADSRAVQLKFIEKFGLEFPMIPDPEKVIIDAYGAREVLGLAAKRKTFLVDPKGRIAHVWQKVKVEGHADDVVDTIRGLSGERA